MSAKTLAPMPTSLMLSALMLAPAAFAADAPQAKPADGKTADGMSDDAKSETLKDVVVEGKTDQQLSSPKYTKPLLDTPQTTTIVPASVMQQQGASTLKQALKNSPGISMQAGEGGSAGPSGDNFSIRGFVARRDIFVDGVRDFGSYSRDPFNLEQVEIIKGPSSALGGRGSTGGSVNLVTKQAQKDTFYAGSVGVGTDSYKRLTLDVNQSLDNGDDRDGIKGAAFRINAVGFDADTPGRDIVTNQRMGLAPTITFGLDSPTQLSIGFFHMQQDNIPDFGIPFVPVTGGVAAMTGLGNHVAPVPYSNFYGLAHRDYEKINANIGTVTLHHDFENGVVLTNHTQYGSTARDSITTAPRFVGTFPTTNINHELQSLDQTDTNLTNQTNLTFKFDTVTFKHTLVTGAEFSQETSINYGRGAYAPGTSPFTSAPLATAAFPTTNLFNPDPYQAYNYSVQRTGAKTDTTANSQAFYLFDTVDLDEQWSVMGGARWERFDTKYKSTSSIFTGSTVTNLGNTDEMLSWRGSVSYKPAKNGNIYVSSGTSFNPSATDLSLASTATAANNFNIGPEKSISYEVGTKWNFCDDTLLLSAAAFRTDKTNARTEDPTNPADSVVLEGKQRVQGIELGATGKLTKEWSVMAGYAYMDSEILSSKNALEQGNRLSSTPENSGNLWTVYSLPFGLDVGGGLSWVGNRVVNATDTRHVPGYVTLDAMAAYHVSSHFTLRLNVYNLTDKDYVQDMYNIGSSGHVVPGAGRSAVLSGEFKF